ncbi:hypothetical protein ACQKFN_14005 [Serratia sp. NPDC071084]|uniref:hypothetical protein n=1 Tax=unclassified Serratia (in: enterobacteria) TaxID=2647522 RepID=UPI0037D64095
MLNPRCRPGAPGHYGGLIPEGIALRGMPLTVGAWHAAPGWLFDAEYGMQAGHTRPLRWVDTGDTLQRSMLLLVGAWHAAPGWLFDAEYGIQAGHTRPLRWVDTDGIWQRSMLLPVGAWPAAPG